jgi:hypothetical protein
MNKQTLVDKLVSSIFSEHWTREEERKLLRLFSNAYFGGKYVLRSECADENTSSGKYYNKIFSNEVENILHKTRQQIVEKLQELGKMELPH